jgi:hypothetical protein
MQTEGYFYLIIKKIESCRGHKDRQTRKDRQTDRHRKNVKRGKVLRNIFGSI